MIGQRHMHLEVEMWKWLAVVALAGALALMWASRTAGGEATVGGDVRGEPSVPGLLPPDMERWAEPMDMEELAVPPESGQADDFLAEWNADLWQILDLHRQGQVEEAINAWADMPLPCETEVWRYLALAAAYLQCGDAEDARAMLDAAESLEPENPVLHYYVGILRMHQAERAPEWYDAVGETPARLVSWVPREIAPNSRAMYELAAMTSLQRALDLAPYLQRNQLLIAADATGYQESSMSRMPPMIHDLLMAIGADNFEGKSHNMLSYLCLDRGWLNKAEGHMDEAVRSGLSLPYGYADLGDRYEREGRNLDAARGYLKQMAQGGPVVRPARKFFENLRKAVAGAL